MIHWANCGIVGFQDNARGRLPVGSSRNRHKDKGIGRYASFAFLGVTQGTCETPTPPAITVTEKHTKPTAGLVHRQYLSPKVWNSLGHHRVRSLGSGGSINFFSVRASEVLQGRLLTSEVGTTPRQLAAPEWPSQSKSGCKHHCHMSIEGHEAVFATIRHIFRA